VRVPERDLAAGGRAHLVDSLVRSRLLRRDGEADEAAIEVVHEALALRWPPLHGWLEETRADRELCADLEYEAERWQAGGRPADLLWRGTRLAHGERIRDRVDPLGREFLLAGGAAQQRAARTRRAVLFGVGVLTAVAAVVVVFLLVLRGRLADANAEVDHKMAELGKLETQRVELEAAQTRLRKRQELEQQRGMLALAMEENRRTTAEAADKVAAANRALEGARKEKVELENKKIGIELENKRLIEKQTKLRGGELRDLCKEIIECK
jgi:hypothetical protein